VKETDLELVKELDSDLGFVKETGFVKGTDLVLELEFL
jgi:hypothetical protein